MVIMLAMHVSFAMLEAWYARTSSLISLSGSGLTLVDGVSSFL